MLEKNGDFSPRFRLVLNGSPPEWGDLCLNHVRLRSLPIADNCLRSGPALLTRPMGHLERVSGGVERLEGSLN